MASKFKRDLDRFSRLVESRLESAARGAAIEFGERVILRTPVDTGRARGGWQTSVGAAPSGPAPDRAPEAALGELRAEAGRLELGERLVISNNVEYIRVLEDGSSAQAPEGMVRVTIAEWRDIVRRAVARAGGRR